MAAIGTTAGNSLIVERVADMLVEPLAAASVILDAGPRIIDSSEPVRVPTLATAFDPAWVGENELIPEVATTFGELELMPTSRKSIKSIVRVSNELIRMATRGVSQTLQTRLVTDVRDKLDTALLNGEGVDGDGDPDGTVTGLVHTPGALTGDFDAEDPDSVLDAVADMAAAEITPTVLYMNGADFFTMRKVKDTTGRALIQPDVTQGARFTLHGIPVRVSSKVAEGAPVLVDMSKVVVVRDLAPAVDILTERYAEYDQTGIRVRARYDIGVLHPSAVLVMSSGE